MQDEHSGNNLSSVVNSITPDLNGGVIVSFNFGQTQSNGRPPASTSVWANFDDTYFGPNLNLTAFTDSEVTVTLLTGSADAAVDVQPYIQEGSTQGYAFDGFNQAGAEVFPQRGGPTLLSDAVLANGGANVADDIRWGFQVFPQPTYSAPDPFGTGPELLEIDPVAVPEPASLGLLGLAIPALLARRRNASK
jgi:hypothetical protein